MVLESLEPKENDKFLKKKNFQHFGGFRAPPKPPLLGFRGVWGGPKPPKMLKKIFFKRSKLNQK